VGHCSGPPDASGSRGTVCMYVCVAYIYEHACAQVARYINVDL
jgi:hypothetical protein